MYGVQLLSGFLVSSIALRLTPVPPPRPTPSSLPARPPSDSVDEFWSGWYGDLQLWQLPVTKKKAGRVLQTHSPLFRL